MWGNSSPGAVAARFARLVEQLGGDVGHARAMGQQRDPPAVSRAIDALVRSGHVVREPDPDNRRRLALRLSEVGRGQLESPITGDAGLEARLKKLAASELRALERGIEILERLPK